MSLSIERWATLKNASYEVSDHGNVRRLRDGLVLKPSTGKLGYPRVVLYYKGKAQTLLIHQAVAECFIGDKPIGFVVDHIDGTKDNNHVSNLQYLTHADNIRKGYDGKRGDSHHASKLTDLQVAEIRTRRMAGEKGSRLAVEFSVSPQTVCDIVKLRSRKDASYVAQ